MSSGLLDRPAARPPEPPDPRPRHRRLVTPLPTDRLAGWLGPLAVTALAAYLRFWHLTSPRGKIFDEIYYACDARNLLRYGVEHATKADNPHCIPIPGAGYVVHPPLGKWIIAVGELLFGDNELGWRFSSALIGSLSVLLVARIGRRLTRSTMLGCLAGLLLAMDGLEFVQSRVSMLDIFGMFWILAAFGCLLVDRDVGRARLAAPLERGGAPPSGAGPHHGVRWWRIGAGACLGAACAVKWSGVYYLVLLVVLAFAWDVGARRTAGVRRPLRAGMHRDLPPILASFGITALAVYAASWSGWFLGGADAWDHNRYLRGQGTLGHVGAVLHGWLTYHREVLQFHQGLHSPHPYQSHPIGWLLLARPVSYFYASPKPGQDGCRAATNCAREVLGVGTPAIWWASIGVLVALLWLWVARRDWRAGATLLGILAAIVPWFPDDVHRRTMFFFYALPAVPFMALGLALCAGWLLGPRDADPRRRTWASAAVSAYTAVVVLNFFYLYPIFVGQVLPYTQWHHRMWMPSWV